MLEGGGDSSAEYVRRVLGRAGLVDGGRLATPRVDGPTWRNSRGVARRLDYIYLGNPVFVTGGKTVPLWFSDHDAVVILFKSGAPSFGPGYWRLNVSVLQESRFKTEFGVFFRGLEGLKPLFDGLVQWWEAAKLRIKFFVSDFCKRRARQEKRKMVFLQRQLEGLHSCLNYGGRENLEVIDLIKGQLREHSEVKARAHLIRSRHEWLETNEKCTASFFGSSKVYKAKQVFRGILNKQGVIVREPGAMLSVATEHYEGLFKGREVSEEVGEEFLSFLSSRVPEGLVGDLEGPITLQELEGALRQMGKRKAPGIDGLPVEFYLEFWGELGPVVLEVLGEVLQSGHLGGTMAQGVISLVHKKGDPSDLGNWRPLTMLTVDYKLLAKVLAGRLRQVMPDVVAVDQTCGVAGNLQLIRDCIAWAEQRGLPLMVVALDQAKAFDRVHWGFLFRALARMGFGQRFVQWLQVLYRDAESRVSVNGHLGECFRLGAGVRQGCPLSPLLYVLYLEPLAAAIRADRGIRGFPVPGTVERVKLSLYADDATLLLDRERCLDRALEIIRRFGEGSGAALNEDKTSLKFFGIWAGRRDAPGGLSLCEGPVKVLGVLFEVRGSATLNWTSKLQKAQRKLALWGSRALSFSGKVLVLKVDIIPVLTYLAYIYPLPACMRRDLVRMVFKFVWGGGYEYVSRDRMMAGNEEGGRDVPHLPLRLDCTFVGSMLGQMAGGVVHPSGHFLRVYFSYQARHMIAWSNAGLRSEQLPWHYGHASKWLKKHPEVKDWRVEQGLKGLYAGVRRSVAGGASCRHQLGRMEGGAAERLRQRPEGYKLAMSAQETACERDPLQAQAHAFT